MRALVIDDDQRLRPIIARLMKCLGFELVMQAGDGEEAMQHLAGGPVDLILTDLRMPRMDGICFVRGLRKQGDKTPVIMLSGETDAESAARAMKAGVDHFVTKPVDPEVLSKTIRRLMTLHHRRERRHAPAEPAPPLRRRG